MWHVVAVNSSQPLIITDSLHQLDGHSGRVTSLSWSLHRDGLLATASYDWLSLVRYVSITVNMVVVITAIHAVMTVLPLSRVLIEVYVIQ